MSENQRKGPEESVLPAVAAVHVLLATHPELALLPMQWLITPGEVTILIDRQSPMPREAAEALATALGVEVRPGIAFEHEGEWHLPLYIEAVLGGAPLFASAHVAVDGSEAKR
ncbi:hypothetical protein AB0O91_21805 [Kitasatospora sp. NPDC089797]|uniref:hypothetical protein n=1 Tax=Kitasatospora sp. NPDC089797 TaxID=3155298 RepID=UPI00342F95F8